MQLGNIDPKLKNVIYKIGYHGFWIILLLRIVGIGFASYYFVNQRYIPFVVLLIISIPSFEYTYLYGKEIKKLLKRIFPVKTKLSL